MNSEVKEKWLTALRSDEYTQGRMRLHRKDPVRGDTFCCLGVLCDIAVDNGVIPEPVYEDEDRSYSYADSTAILPVEVTDWAGLEQSLPEVTTESGAITTLAVLNDFNEYDFKQIATVIEEQL